jgi:alkylhydroperoxidase family enzyme
MPYIKVISPPEASGRLSKIYQKVSGPGGQVDNVLQIHSLRPHSLEGHMALYKAVLHHPRNKLPTWFLEALGVLVSLLNNCSYCARHHSAGMKRQLKRDAGRYDAYRAQLDRGEPGAPFSEAEQAAADIDKLKSAGLKDGRILEINQVAAYFAYANRTVTGLGVDTAGEVLGLHPEKSGDWHHA